MMKNKRAEKIKKDLFKTLSLFAIPKKMREYIGTAIDLAYSTGRVDEGKEALKIMKKLK